MKEITILKDRTIKTQQKIIDALKDENQKLRQEIDSLNAELEIAKNLPQETQAIKAEYERLLEMAKKAKKEYDTLSHELKELKAKYNKDMKKFLKKVQREL